MSSFQKYHEFLRSHNCDWLTISGKKMSSRASRTLYVGNLPGDIREKEVEDLFYKVIFNPPPPRCLEVRMHIFASESHCLELANFVLVRVLFYLGQLCQILLLQHFCLMRLEQFLLNLVLYWRSYLIIPKIQVIYVLEWNSAVCFSFLYIKKLRI